MLKRKHFIYLLSIAGFLLLSGEGFAQSKSTAEKKQKEAEKRKLEQKAEEAAFIEESRKHTRDIQDKKTKKRMKKSAKKARRNRENKRGGFFKRIFK